MKMLNRNSIYYLNMRDPQAIVYTDAKGTVIHLTRADFASEEEFLTWKALSDEDYRLSEKAGRGYYDRCIPVIEAIDAPLPSAEDMLLAPMLEAERIDSRVALLEQVRSSLTQKQYNRLCMYYLDGMTEQEIATVEGVAQRRVSKSISSGKKVINKFLKKFLFTRG